MLKYILKKQNNQNMIGEVQKKIAFCFLIYDTINNESLWNDFFNKVNRQKYQIHIHYKFNKSMKFFDKYKLDNTIETKYGDISLVHAQNLLIKEALKDKSITHIIFLSNSCIPVKSFDHVYNFLDINKSYFNKSPDHQVFPKCDSIKKYVSETNIKKGAQWCILNRKHAEVIVNNEQYLDYFKDICAADENVYITTLYDQNLSNELILTNNISLNATTFINWSDMDYKYIDHEGLKTYNTISKEEMNLIKQSKSLFARKFNINFSIK